MESKVVDENKKHSLPYIITIMTTFYIERLLGIEEIQ
jgi:hypothetical protein